MDTTEPDLAEVRRWLARRHCPHATIRFACHVHSRDPANIWAPMKLAGIVGDPAERVFFLDEAVLAGWRKWMAELAGARKVRWWGDRATRYFMKAMLACAREHGLTGGRDTSLRLIGELLALDPRDRVGAEELARILGLISEVDVEAAHSFRM